MQILFALTDSHSNLYYNYTKKIKNNKLLSLEIFKSLEFVKLTKMNSNKESDRIKKIKAFLALNKDIFEWNKTFSKQAKIEIKCKACCSKIKVTNDKVLNSHLKSKKHLKCLEAKKEFMNKDKNLNLANEKLAKEKNRLKNINFKLQTDIDNLKESNQKIFELMNSFVNEIRHEKLEKPIENFDMLSKELNSLKQLISNEFNKQINRNKCLNLNNQHVLKNFNEFYDKIKQEKLEINE